MAFLYALPGAVAEGLIWGLRAIGVYISYKILDIADLTVDGSICTDKKVPVYTSYGGTVCYASLSIDYYQLGYQTGLMVAQILLEGKSPADIEIQTLPPSVAYNKDLCAALGIEVPAN